MLILAFLAILALGANAAIQKGDKSSPSEPTTTTITGVPTFTTTIPLTSTIFSGLSSIATKTSSHSSLEAVATITETDTFTEYIPNPSPTPIANTSTISSSHTAANETTSATNSQQVGQVRPSMDGLCGVQGNGTILWISCYGSTFGRCCSKYGRCGNSIEFCGNGCQTPFGNCDSAEIFTTAQRTQSIAPNPSPTVVQSGNKSRSQSPEATDAAVSSLPSSSIAVPTTKATSTSDVCGLQANGTELVCNTDVLGLIGCCSKYSRCGSTSDHCCINKGCQVQYGRCTSACASSNISSTSTRTIARQTSHPPSSPGLKPRGTIPTYSISTDGYCGRQENGTVLNSTCLQSRFGNCCSQHGVCGSTSEYCCSAQPGYGVWSKNCTLSSTSISNGAPVMSPTAILVTTIGTVPIPGPISSDTDTIGKDGEDSSDHGSPVESHPFSDASEKQELQKNAHVVIHPLPEAYSFDGRCGIVDGVVYTCPGTYYGPCCSKWLWCGITGLHCLPSNGCITTFGDCAASG